MIEESFNYFIFSFSLISLIFLADSIAAIPGNEHFTRCVDFSSAFHHTCGQRWYIVVETLFLISCAVQACAGIVESAQSLDGFIASFVLGETYAIQIVPDLRFISWSTNNCYAGNEFQDEASLEGRSVAVCFTLSFILI